MQQKLKPYWQALPDIITYQIITKPLIGLWIYLLGRITQTLLTSTGRVAITSGDFMFLFKTWQGYLILLLGLVSLFIYVAFDINTKIVLARNLVTGEEQSVWKSMDEGFRSISALLSLQGGHRGPVYCVDRASSGIRRIDFPDRGSVYSDLYRVGDRGYTAVSCC